ncbi:hypothetical protein LTR78_010937 [Recurvomyces mirabilis]|uniref:Uncharacterized protein n=1 Tax=Recurvomyces mirabilis TaxID=574656 RepID=A0AAE0TPJ1_9PEZI|nr:hypothetical protein LTR78_010937 [Recurvomyces mirabilis]KAK5154996.1 hypothetical protein LTS14_005951 [Recurvomyces mirabilis]
MPLAERDINTQREPRLKRHSTKANLSYSRLKDENSPLTSPTSKASPPSSPLLAPTKASAAKASPPSSRAIDQTVTPSRLPRRMDSSVASPRSTATSTRSSVLSSRHSTPTAMTDKPLPAPPVAQIRSAMSPARNSRTLVDASDKSMRMRGYTPLTPKASLATPVAESPSLVVPSAEIDDFSTHPGQTDTIFSPDRWANDVSNGLIDTALSAIGLASPGTVPSLESSYSSLNSIGTNDKVGHGTTEAAVEHDLLHDYEEPSHEVQMAEELLSNSMYCSTTSTKSRGVLESAAAPPNHPVPGFADLMATVPSARSESRPHSPSPASFSRPRPSSISHGRVTPSPMTPSIATSRSVRAQKTASRIPIPEPTKGMLVDVKPRGSTYTTTPSIKSTHKSTKAPSFGTRRLDAAGALEKLDQGIKRRQLSQLKRTIGFDSSTTTLSTIDKNYGRSAGSMTDRSHASTPDNTFATSSSDDEEVVTPSWPHGTFYDSDDPHRYGNTSPATFYRHPAASLFYNAAPSFSKGPPSTSPYTVPLQTIPSQAALPLYADLEEPLDMPPITSNSTSLRDRLSISQEGRPNEYPKQSWRQQPLLTNYSFMDLLDEYIDQDGRISTQGFAPFDKEAKRHITRTLSILEGNGAPFQNKVDEETIQERFGHIKCGMDRATKEASFMKNAAAAQKFLAQDAVVLDDADMHGLLPEAKDHKTDIIDNIKPQLPQIEPIASKWSDSTASLQAILPDLVDVSPHQTNTMAIDNAIPQVQRKAVPEPPRSIGYPSRVESKKVMALIGPGSADLSPLGGPPRRLSSPSLDKRKPGSVKTARETLPGRGFSRPTASAEAKKAPKMPTPNTKQFNIVGGSHRGRNPSAEKGRSQSEGNNVQKAKRARSRSRLVIDKLQGMFSHRRDKRASDMPQIPAVAEDGASKKEEQSTVRTVAISKPPKLAGSPTMDPRTPSVHHTPQRKDSKSTSAATPPSTLDKSTSAHDDRSSVLSWGEKLRAKAARESDPVRKLRLLEFVQVLRESHENARNAQISCLAAREAAVQASASYALVQQGTTMLQRLAAQIGGPDA